MTLKNWSGNLHYGACTIHYPETIEELQKIVRGSTKLRALGSRHSFNTIADSTEDLVCFDKLNGIVQLDNETKTITVAAGIKYGEVCAYLHENGYALHNLASLPHISVAGSIATATHGSGVENGNLATAVTGIEFINVSGDIIRLSKKDGETFYGAVVGLGALGLVTKITLDLLPTFAMQQVVYRNLPLEQLKNNFNAIMSSGYSVSLFTDWKNKNFNEVWVKTKIDPRAGSNTFEPEFYDAKLAVAHLHPIEDQPAENCTDQLGIPGAWYERLPHFKMGFMPSAGKELQSEYFIPMEYAYDAICAVEKLHDKIAPHIFISEIRAIEADSLWMSPCYKKRCVAIHTTWKQDEAVEGLLSLMEKQLEPFKPLPHWGKLFVMEPSVLQSRLVKLNAFKQLMSLYDPQEKFCNPFIKKMLFCDQ